MGIHIELVISLACAVAGVFLLLNAPVRIAGQVKAFKLGPAVPHWTLRALTLLNRIAGAWALMVSIAFLLKLLT